MKLQRDLREFIGLLSSHGADFVVIGAHAVAYYGHPRYTGDLDLLVRPSLENGRRVVAALADFGFGEIGLGPEDFVERERVIQLGRVPNRIDLLTSISGVDFDEVWRTRAAAALDGLPVSFIGREALIKNKRATGRAQDLADAERLESSG